MSLIRLKTNGFRTAIKNKQLVEVIDKIISSHPLSYVNLERLRKEVDSLDEIFWMKDEEGKYLLVNDKFASKFHLTPSQIEGKPVEKFIPAYMMNFNKALTEYAQESKSVFIIEGFPLSGVPAGEDFQIIEIPVPSTEGNLSIIIGIAQKIKSEEKSDSSSLSFQLLKDLLKNYFLINNENKISEVSAEFCTTFSLRAEELLGKSYNSDSSGIPVLISRMTDDFIESGKISQSSKINLPAMPDNDFNIHFIKGKDEEKIVFVEIINSAETSLQTFNSESGSYDFLLLNNPEPVFIYDKEDLKFLQANEPALKLYGYRKDEFLQLDLTDLYTPDDIQTLLEDSDSKFKEGVYSKPHRQKGKNGQNIFVETNRTLIKYKNKPAYLNTIRNVSERLNLEKEKQHFNALFNNSNDLIFVTDKEGFIKSVSNSITENLGYSGKSLIETSFATLIVDEDRGKINSSVFHSNQKEKLIFETSLKKNGSEYLHVKLIANPVFDFKNEVVSFNIICSSVESEVKEVVKEIIKEVPVDVNKEVPSTIPEVNFLSSVFHDLLTPINVIIGFVQDLTENIEKPTEEQKEALEIITQNKENLLELINQTVEFIQTEKEQVEFNLEQIKIIDVIEELRNEIEANKISGDYELAFGKISSSLETITDKEKILRYFVLIINLIFRITNQKKLYISATGFDEEHFAICLSDNYNSTSQPFYQKLAGIFSDGNKNIKIPGVSSFSLKLSKNIIALLQGSFKTIEEKDKTEAMFVFPIKLNKDVSDEKLEHQFEKTGDINTDKDEFISKPEPTQLEDDESIKIKSSFEPQELPKQRSLDFSQLSCLYIEDQLDSQMLFSMQLKDLQEIDFAVNLEQALPLLRNKSFDFIVVDINLQGDYNGLDILRIIRTMPDYEDTPVIAVTAYLLPVDKEVYIQAGFSDFISKPILRESLISSLERILIPQI